MIIVCCIYCTFSYCSHNIIWWGKVLIISQCLLWIFRSRWFWDIWNGAQWVSSRVWCVILYFVVHLKLNICGGHRSLHTSSYFLHCTVMPLCCVTELMCNCIYCCCMWTADQDAHMHVLLMVQFPSVYHLWTIGYSCCCTWLLSCKHCEWLLSANHSCLLASLLGSRHQWVLQFVLYHILITFISRLASYQSVCLWLCSVAKW